MFSSEGFHERVGLVWFEAEIRTRLIRLANSVAFIDGRELASDTAIQEEWLETHRLDHFPSLLGLRIGSQFCDLGLFSSFFARLSCVIKMHCIVFVPF